LLPVAVGLLAALTVGSQGVASASTQTAAQLTAMTAANPQPTGSTTEWQCVNSTGQIAWVEVSDAPHACAQNLNLWHVGGTGATGPAGPAGPAGPKGDTGAQGPSGVQALTTKVLTEQDGIPAGGSFFALAPEVGTMDLAAGGTYQVCVNGKIEQPTASTGQLSAQLFLYDTVKNAGFAGDLLNVSTDTQGGTTHDAYANGCTMIKETGAVTLHLYGFGYLSNSGSAVYNLMPGATISAIQLTPAA
jgi:hypothetical protein